MIEINVPGINADELMEKIRVEVRGREKRMRGAVYPKGEPLNVGPTSDLELIEFREKGYHLNDFLTYHGRDFVMNAYHAILMRWPDSEALEYFVGNLTSGKMTKVEVLGRLRYSPEGRVKGVRVRGLLWSFGIQSSFKIPVLGYIFRRTAGIAD